ncbi:hypothetical protein CWI42_011650 [Ordospora colligata]|nr:hypothetical protein CWI42_011650 [Ordospora colligata]
MIENLDGFIFKRRMQPTAESEVRMSIESKRRDLSVIKKDTDDIFSFRFVNEKRCKGVEYKEDEISGILSDEEGFSESVVIKENKKKNVEEIHMELDNGVGLEELVKKCIRWLESKKRTAYGMKIEQAMSEGCIKRRDANKEIVEAIEKIQWTVDEEKKWKMIKESTMEMNKIKMEKKMYVRKESEYERKIAKVNEEFASKMTRLRFVKESAKVWIGRMREQSEELLRRMFDAVHKEKEADTVFLLKALSRAER